LALQYLLHSIAVAFGQGFADTKDSIQADLLNGCDLFSHHCIAFAKPLPALAVADYKMLYLKRL
jgi:hypothetical protein